MDLTSMMKKRPFGKQLINSAAIIAAAAVIVLIMTALGCGMWVPMLSLCLWAMQGLKTDFKSILSAYLSIAIGLTMGYLMGHAEQLGTPAIIVFAILTLLLLHGMANQVMTFCFNNYTAVFCTVSTAISFELTIIKDWAFALIVFGLLPATIVAIISKKKKA